jgi:hypothetical protein
MIFSLEIDEQLAIVLATICNNMLTSILNKHYHFSSICVCHTFESSHEYLDIREIHYKKDRHHFLRRILSAN